MPNTSDCAGLVMAGGLSTRMGEGADKALLRPWGEDGPTLLARAHAVLSVLARPVFVACRAGAAHPGFSCVEDVFPRCGPAGGIHAGLKRIRSVGMTAALVMACDMPRMDAPFLSRLLDAWNDAAVRGDHPLAVVFRLRGTRLFQSLAAVYDVAALPLFEDALKAGRRRLLDIIPEDRRLAVDFDEPDLGRFLNVNTPDDLAGIGRNFSLRT